MEVLAKRFGWGEFGQPSVLHLPDTYSELSRSSILLRILVRDKFTCQVCSFSSKPTERVLSGYMQVAQIDEQVSNVTAENYACLCPFCNAYGDVPFALSSGRFRLGYSKELDRITAANLLRALMVYMDSDSTIARSEAVNLFDTLASTDSHVLSKLEIISSLAGKTASDKIRLFFELLQSRKNDDLISKTHLFSSGLFLIPVRKHWKAETAYWAKSSYSDYSGDLASLRKAMGH